MFQDETSEESQECPDSFEFEPKNTEMELQVAQEELASRLEELKVVTMANFQAQGELTYMRRLVDDLNVRLSEAMDISIKDRERANKIENASFASAEDWKADMEAMEKQYQADVARLQKENKYLMLEYVAANKLKDETMMAKQSAVEEAYNLSLELEKAKVAVAVLSQETRKSDRVVDELTKQNVDLTDAYAACHTAAQAGIVKLAEKEAELRKQVAALFQAKQQAEVLRWELFESRQSETRLCEMENELVLLKEELAKAKELNHEQTKVVMDMDAKLQEAHSEVHQARTAETEAATLLISMQAEARELCKKWEMACAEVSMLKADLEASTRECSIQQMQILELQEKEVCACAQAADSEAKLLVALKDISKAICEEQSKDEALKHTAYLLQDAELESQTLRQQIYEILFEVEVENQKALLMNEAVIIEEIVSLQEILKVAGCKWVSSKLENLLHNGYQLKQALAVCQPAAQKIVLDLEVANEQLDTARAEVEMLKAAVLVAVSEAALAKQEREQAQMNISDARQESFAEQEQLRIARDDVLMENTRLEQLILEEQGQLRIAREEAFAANARLEQLEQKVLKASKVDINAAEKVKGKSREASEAWEMVESGSDALVTVKQEEYDALKLNVSTAMESKSLIEKELLSLRSVNQRLLSQMDATNSEMKGLRISEQNTRQLYEKLQQGNGVLESEVQRLKGENLLKTWDLRALGPHKNALQSMLPLAVGREVHHGALPCSLSEDFSSSQKEEEEESTEFLSLSTKKKKKKNALFLRIGTFMTKKMN